MSTRLKSLMAVWGLFLLLPALAYVALCCPAWFLAASMMLTGGPEALVVATGFVVLMALSLGGGGFTLYQSYQSMTNKPSRPLRLPPL